MSGDVNKCAYHHSLGGVNRFPQASQLLSQLSLSLGGSDPVDSKAGAGCWPAEVI